MVVSCTRCLFSFFALHVDCEQLIRFDYVLRNMLWRCWLVDLACSTQTHTRAVSRCSAVFTAVLCFDLLTVLCLQDPRSVCHLSGVCCGVMRARCPGHGRMHVQRPGRRVAVCGSCVRRRRSSGQAACGSCGRVEPFAWCGGVGLRMWPAVTRLCVCL